MCYPLSRPSQYMAAPLCLYDNFLLTTGVPSWCFTLQLCFNMVRRLNTTEAFPWQTNAGLHAHSDLSVPSPQRHAWSAHGTADVTSSTQQIQRHNPWMQEPALIKTKHQSCLLPSVLSWPNFIRTAFTLPMAFIFFTLWLWDSSVIHLTCHKLQQTVRSESDFSRFWDPSPVV